MEWAIPAQSFAPLSAHIAPPSKNQKPMASLSYTDDLMTLPALSILLPTLPVKEYDSQTGKLSLSLSGHPSILAKLQAFQVRMLHAIYSHYSTWFPGERSRSVDETNASFQPLILNGCIHLYCPLMTVGSFNEITLYSDGAWSKGVIPIDLFTVGKQIRIAIKLQGISFHQHPVSRTMTGRSRVQHRILAIYKS
jgi:hypothetical protein